MFGHQHDLNMMTALKQIHYVYGEMGTGFYIQLIHGYTVRTSLLNISNTKTCTNMVLQMSTNFKCNLPFLLGGRGALAFFFTIIAMYLVIPY